LEKRKSAIKKKSSSVWDARFRLRYGFTRLNLFCSTEVKEFQSTREWAFIPGTASSMYSAPRLLEDARAIRYDKGPRGGTNEKPG